MSLQERIKSGLARARSHFIAQAGGWKWLHPFLGRSRRFYAIAGSLMIIVAGAATYAIRQQLRKVGMPPIEDFQSGIVYDDSILRIVQATPTGELNQPDQATEIVVVFNHPIVPLGAFRGRSDAPIGISPDIPGSFRWYGSRVAAFVPSKKFSPGTEYRVTIPAGTAALNGMKLKKDYSFQFRTALLEVQQKYPYNGSVGYRPEFQVQFNYPVELSEARSHIKLLANGNSVPIGVQYPTKENNHIYVYGNESLQKMVLITTLSNLPRGASLSLVVDKGMKPAGGNIGMAADVSFPYETYGPLKAAAENKADYFEKSWLYGLQFNNPVRRRDLARFVEISPKTKFISSGDNSTTEFLSLRNWAVTPEETYTLTILPGLRDAFGNAITGDTKFTIKAPMLRKSVSLDSGVDHIEANGPKAIPIYVSGLDKVHMEVGHFDLDDICDYAASDKGGIDISYNDEKVFDFPTGLNARTSGTIGFKLDPYLKEGKGWVAVTIRETLKNDSGKEEEVKITRYIQSTDLALAAKAGKGAIHGWVRSLSTGNALQGVQLKIFEGNSKLGECYTTSDGHCSVETDEDYDENKLVFYANRRDDEAVLVGKNHDLYMWSVNRYYDGSSHASTLGGEVVFDRKLYRPGDTVHFAAFLGVRKDGKLLVDSSSLGSVTATVSDAGGNQIYSSSLDASDYGNVGGDFPLPEDGPLGHYTISLTSKKVAGESKHGVDSVYDTFQVEEFRPAEFSLDWKGHGKRSRVASMLKAVLEAHYLFGAPMQNAKATYTINRKPMNPTFDRKTDFFFGDDEYEDRWEPPTYSFYSNGSGNLDQVGQLHVSFPLEAMEPEGLQNYGVSRSYSLELDGTVSDVDQRSISGKAELSVYAGDTLPGILVKNRYQSKGNTFQFELTAIENDGGQAKPIAAEVIVHRKEWRTIQSRGAMGGLQRRNTLVRTEVARTPVSLSDDALPYEFVPQIAGEYTLTLHVKNSKAYSRLNFFASGSGYIGWDFHNDDTITLVPDKASYRPGETAKILIESPYKQGEAIVTVEREKVLWQTTVAMNGNGEPVAIPIRSDFSPDVYVGVMVMQGRTSQKLKKVNYGNYVEEVDAGKPQMKVGMVRLNIDLADKRLPLKVETNQPDYKPGENVKLSISTDPGSELVISVADRAVLDLVNYKFADPIGFFFDNWPLGVKIFNNYKSLIQRMSFANKGAAPGGKGWSEAGNGEGGFSEDGEDGKRKIFKETAYWSQKTVADASGVAHVQFQLPHNLTTFRVQVLGGKSGRYNYAIHEFQVKKDLVARPLLPRFLRPGDSVEVGAAVTNQSTMALPMKVKLQSPLLRIAGGAEKSMIIGSGETKEITFQVSLNSSLYEKKRTDSMKKARSLSLEKKDGALHWNDLLIKAATVEGEILAYPVRGDSSLKDRVSFSFPVKEAPPVEAFAVSGFTDEKATEGFEVPSASEVNPEVGYLNVSLSPTALVGLEKGFQFYASNAYFCLEQRSSAFLLRMAAGKMLRDFQYTPPGKAGYDFDTIETLFLGELKHFQNDDGGFRLWKEHPGPSDPYLTAYVVYILQEAERSPALGGDSYNINGSIYRSAMNYLREYIRKPDKEYVSYILESAAFIQFLLARDGDHGTRLEDFLLEHEKQLSLRAKGYLAMAIALRRRVKDYRQDSDLARLMKEFQNSMVITTNRVDFRDNPSGFYSRAFYSRGSVLGVMLQAFQSLDPKNPLIPQMVNAIMADSSHQFWFDSHSTGILSIALFEYRHLYESDGGSFTASVAIDERSLWKAAFTDKENHQKHHRIALDQLMKRYAPGKVHNLDLMSGDKKRLYYTASLIYSPAAKNQDPVDQGMEVRREIVPVSNPSTVPFEAGVTGDSIVMKRGVVYLNRVTVVTTKPVYNFLYTDPLPSNLEGVNTSFQTESATFARFLEEKRNRAQNGGDDAEYNFYAIYHAPVYSYREDAVVVTQDYLEPGVHEFFYMTRPLVKGASLMPAASAYGMYEPYIFGKSGGTRLIVE